MNKEQEEQQQLLEQELKLRYNLVKKYTELHSNDLLNRLVLEYVNNYNTTSLNNHNNGVMNHFKDYLYQRDIAKLSSLKWDFEDGELVNLLSFISSL